MVGASESLEMEGNVNDVLGMMQVKLETMPFHDLKMSTCLLQGC